MFFILSCSSAAYAAHECESWASASLASVLENGGKITLDDGSIWRIDPQDIVMSARWQPNASIEICGNHTLTNTNEGESVGAMTTKFGSVVRNHMTAYSLCIMNMQSSNLGLCIEPRIHCFS